MSKEDGGPAFPVNVMGEALQPGMSLRAYAAIAAMQGLIAQEDLSDGEAGTPQAIAKGAVAFADALLKELSK